MTTHLAANLAAAGLGAGVCFALPQSWRDTLLPGVEPDVYALAVWLAPLLALGEFLRAVARSLDRFELQNAFTLLQPLGLVAALGGSLVLAGGGLRAALLSMLTVQVALLLWLGLTLVRVSGLERRIDLGEILRSLRYGLSTYGQSLLIQAQERLELFLVAWLLADSVQIGLFAVAASAANPFRLLPNALSVAVFPELAEREPARAAETAARLTRHAVALTALLCALALPLMPWLVPAFFGPAYAGSVETVVWLLPSVCVLAASRLLARYFQAVDQQRVLLVARGLAVATLGVVGLARIPGAGIVGAAQASLAANAVEAALIGLAFCSVTGLSLRAAFAPRRADLDSYRVRALGLARRLRSGAPLR